MKLQRTMKKLLSQKLDKGGSSSCGGDRMTAITFQAKKQKQIPCSSSRREVGWPLQAGEDINQSHVSKKKAMEPMQAATTEAIDKRAAAFCRNEKKRMDCSHSYKKWFQLVYLKGAQPFRGLDELKVKILSEPPYFDQFERPSPFACNVAIFGEMESIGERL